ncbi:MAG: peptide-methionine (S)-S-oxide reductase MsrA [Alphaproteobacteria bacterium]|nr:peptide-methionine (S)-S-oxide reductase MsrA [Alphaproteobacteria bacterium]
MERATFAAGCFWGVEATFRQIDGVQDAVSGYIGGHTDNPTYKDVCTGKTGHAEAVDITYDADRVSYKSLVKAFFKLHDPTQVNRQGPDIGTQYRSAIFYHSDAQKKTAEEEIAALNATGILHKPIATEVMPAKTFFPAEEYHQRYLEKRGMTSC